MVNPRWEERHTLVTSLTPSQVRARIGQSPDIWVPPSGEEERTTTAVFGHGGRTQADLQFEPLGSGCRVLVRLRLPYPVAAQVAMVWLATLITTGAFLFILFTGSVFSGGFDLVLQGLPVVVVAVIVVVFVINRTRSVSLVRELMASIREGTSGLEVE